MFSFFKKSSDTPKIVDFSFIGTDIHSHLIPGIDDGCASIEHSVACIQKLKELGFSKIITTPHIMAEVYPNTPEIINEGLTILKAALVEAGIDIEIEVGAEYKIDEQFTGLLETDNLLTFGDKYILVEFSFVAAPINLETIIFNLRTKGYRPIIAHPERYLYLSENLAKFEELKALGCHLQLNLMSLVNQYGPKANEIANKLLDMNLYEFMGTDLHRPDDVRILNKLLQSKSILNKLSKLRHLNEKV
ncbi:CpsB/CapC family capsule biosynthesis tyrosine phosphatase [Arcicella aquatica]|uniref:protein-tyrosine-phosphatase n=1 Tax=Arcicella aquatica TaxID=217141 RepID=A0ABU5QL30_9BACT|nr:CpsB/CapC family capsule biosynthesis tyrosine phosphatase [Arcicella aquatica]MEA5257753.1 CpsB/CapC family capsule biosynthesis tyrosine phosphatase [Arcicella aquatica]